MSVADSGLFSLVTLASFQPNSAARLLIFLIFLPSPLTSSYFIPRTSSFTESRNYVYGLVVTGVSAIVTHHS